MCWPKCVSSALILFLVILVHTRRSLALNNWTCRKPRVELAVAPLVSADNYRSLIISWSLESVSPGDYVSLYLTDVVTEPLFSSTINTTTGWLNTGVSENRTAWDSLAFTEQCLGYWVTLRSTNLSTELASSCLGTAPRWMERNAEALKNLSLRRMFLPGTHNSAAYWETTQPYRETLVQRYAFNQDERVLNQLLHGVRVLDLRVGHYAMTPELWWANHGVVRLRPLQQVLDDVILFVNMTKEIVVLDFHRFPVGFQVDSRRLHQQLVKYLEDYLGAYLLPPSLGWGSPLSSLTQTGKQVVLSYDQQSINIDTKLVWPRVVRKWGNVRSLGALQEYMTRVMRSAPYPYPWAAMVELTPNTVDVLTGRLGSLRQLAHQVNGEVTQWFNGDWGELSNIVSVDFFRSTGIVRDAIEWNLRQAQGTKCDFR